MSNAWLLLLIILNLIMPLILTWGSLTVILLTLDDFFFLRMPQIHTQLQRVHIQISARHRLSIRCLSILTGIVISHDLGASALHLLINGSLGLINITLHKGLLSKLGARLVIILLLLFDFVGLGKFEFLGSEEACHHGARAPIDFSLRVKLVLSLIVLLLILFDHAIDLSHCKICLDLGFRTFYVAHILFILFKWILFLQIDLTLLTGLNWPILVDISLVVTKVSWLQKTSQRSTVLVGTVNSTQVLLYTLLVHVSRVEIHIRTHSCIILL